MAAGRVGEQGEIEVDPRVVIEQARHTVRQLPESPCQELWKFPSSPRVHQAAAVAS